MCGIFGFHGPGAPDPGLLTTAAALAGRRGPHGCGWATRDEWGTRTVRHPSPLTERLDEVGRIGARAVLGHSRLATMGDWRDVRQLQPFTVAGHALAHNGSIANPDDLYPGAATDSEALAHAYAAFRVAGRSPYAALEFLLGAIAQHTAWAVVVLDTTGRLYAHRHYHPLYRLDTGGEGVYLSSQRFHPAAELLPEDTAVLV